MPKKFLSKINAPNLPVAMQMSRPSLTGNGTSTRSITVVFEAGRFTDSPIISVSSDNTALVASFSAVTTSGMTVTLRHITGATWTSTNTLHWIAYQMTEYSSIG